VLRPVAELGSMPDAIAASGDRVWVSLPSLGGRRNVLAFAVRWNPATELHFVLPPTGELLPSLGGDGLAESHLAGFAADGGGPWALLLPPAADRFGVRREGASAGPPRLPVILRLDGNAWREVPLPAELSRPRSLASLASGVVAVADGPSGSSLGRREGDGWRVTPIDVAPDSLWLNVAGRDAVGSVEGAGGGAEIVLRYARPGQIVPWASLPLPAEPWFLAGTEAGAALLVRARDGPPTLATIAPLAAAPGPAAALVAPGFAAGAWLHLPLIGMFVVAALMAVAFVRAMSDQGQELVGVTPLGLERRFVGLLIDLLPGLVIAQIALRPTAAEFLRLPSFSTDIGQTLPAVIVIVVTITLGALSEGLTGRSLGKWAVGAVVRRTDGTELSMAQAIVRNIFKGLILATPVLGLFVFILRGHRSIGDVVARTVVAVRNPPAPPAGS
jgi:uncharacterized RDD family membrane protein YckC